jgi:hypothetical protein
MKRFAPFVLAAIVLGIAGCANDAARVPTAPIRSPSLRASVIFSACSSQGHDQSNAERDALFSEPYLTEARNLWNPVKDNCNSNLGVAREAMLTYVQFTIDALRAGHVNLPAPDVPPGTDFPSREAALVNHWNTMFAYVGYPEPGLLPDVLLAGGAAGVITQGTENRELKIPSAAAMTVPVQDGESGDTRGHLFSIYALTGPCLGSGNMTQTGPCFQFSANPKVDPRFDPKVKVGICEPVAANQPIPGAIPALGHEDGGVTNIAAPVGIYPTDCIDLGTEASAGSWTGGLGDIALKLASIAGRVVGVTPAYAAHGGLGGVSEEFSPFGAVDLLLFKATFTNDGPPHPPKTNPPLGPPDVGSWFFDFKKPSEIKVEKKFGDLLDMPVTLDYKPEDKKCGGCVGLTLRGIVTNGNTAGNGRYQVTWWSLSNGPDEDAAAIVLRDSGLREICRVSYASTKKPKADVLQYNGVNVGTWSKGDKQRFDVIVDLGAGTTSLSINGVPVASAQGFVNGGVINLASIAAEFAGDTKKIGWDDITIVRLPD